MKEGMREKKVSERRKLESRREENEEMRRGQGMTGGMKEE